MKNTVPGPGPPVISNGPPAGPLPSGPAPATLQATTDENATCRYATNADVLYDNMTQSFATTGGVGHSQPLTGLTAGTAYNYFVRCRDTAGNTNAADFSISFSVNAVSDTTPPSLSNGQPTGTLPSGTTTATLSVVSNENATCRYATTADVLYTNMTQSFATTGGTTHSQPLSGLTDGGTYNYFVRCRDTAGNANAADFPITFSIAIFVDSTPPSVSITIPTSAASITVYASPTNLGGTAADNVNVTQMSWANSANATNGAISFSPNPGPSVSWSVPFIVLVAGNNPITVTVRDAANNSGTDNLTINYDNVAPVRSGGAPTGNLPTASAVTLTVQTNENASCRFATADSSYGAMTNTFATTGGVSHSQSLGVLPDGTRTYYIHCKDNPGSPAVGNTTTSSYPVSFTLGAFCGDSSCNGTETCGSCINDCAGQTDTAGSECCLNTADCTANAGNCGVATACPSATHICQYGPRTTAGFCGNCGVCATNGAGGYDCQAGDNSACGTGPAACGVCAGSVTAFNCVADSNVGPSVCDALACGACENAGGNQFACTWNSAAAQLDCAAVCSQCMPSFTCANVTNAQDPLGPAGSQCSAIAVPASPYRGVEDTCTTVPCQCNAAAACVACSDFDRDGICDNADSCPYDSQNDLDGDNVCAVGCNGAGAKFGSKSNGSVCQSGDAPVNETCLGHNDSQPFGACSQSTACRIAFGAQTFFDIYVDGKFLTGNNVLYQGPDLVSPDYLPPGNNILYTPSGSQPSFVVGQYLNPSGPHVMAFEIFDENVTVATRELRGYLANTETLSQICTTGGIPPNIFRTKPNTPGVLESADFPSVCYSLPNPGIYDEPPRDGSNRRWNQPGYAWASVPGWDPVLAGNSNLIGNILKNAGYPDATVNNAGTVWGNLTSYSTVRVFCRYEW